MKIVSEQWVEECIKAKEMVGIEAFNIGVLFKIHIQGDRRMFYQQNNNNNRVNGSNANGKRQQKSLQELVEIASRKAADEDILLEDCVISIYDSEL